ncbi:hypothetical protein F8388_006907 [Cannabis sativa]|uniref:Uncharacterized protein n=1 Tax=Cannabis sativa TaxID=3483 RepID=A0A7J6GVK0_CANSA|nr:hypothetical protein F8388_006907 [Cannabis sativa]
MEAHKKEEEKKPSHEVGMEIMGLIMLGLGMIFNTKSSCGSGNQWNGAADYLFGGSDPYVEKRDGGGSYGQPIHCYEKHYQETPLYIQVQPQEDSWSQNFNNF